MEVPIAFWAPRSKKSMRYGIWIMFRAVFTMYCCCCCCRYSLSAACTAFVRGAPRLGWYLPSLPKGAHLQGDLWVSGLVLWPRCYTKVVRTLSHHHPECICSQSLKPSSNTSLPDAWDYSARQIRQIPCNALYFISFIIFALYGSTRTRLCSYIHSRAKNDDILFVFKN